MILATLDHLQASRIRRLGIITMGPLGREVSQRIADFDIEIFDMASLAESPRCDPPFSAYDLFYAFGADVLDGFYSTRHTLSVIRSVMAAAQGGCATSILGFSLNSHPATVCLDELRLLPLGVRMCARDPVSHARLTRLLERRIDLVADLAFLLSPNLEQQRCGSPLSRWITSQKTCGRAVVGINANFLTLADCSRSIQDLITLYADTMTDLHAQKQVSFVFIPHDYRHSRLIPSDLQLARAILAVLPTEIREHSVIMHRCGAIDVIDLCSLLDCTLSGRMHLAIASLSQGTPVVSLTYQGKMEGLFHHFSLPDFAIPFQRAAHRRDLGDKLALVLESRREIKRHITTELPRIRSLARENFAGHGTASSETVRPEAECE